MDYNSFIENIKKIIYINEIHLKEYSNIKFDIFLHLSQLEDKI